MNLCSVSPYLEDEMAQPDLVDSTAGGERQPTVAHAIRGLLIVMVVLGHDRLLFETIPFYFAAIYFWHVLGFFFLAYGRPRGSVAAASIPDRLARYLVPFVVFAVPLAAVQLIAGPLSANRVGTAVAAVTFGSAPLLQLATGLSLLWFLPALAGFSIATIVLARLEIRRPGAAWLAPMLALVAAVAALSLPAGALQYLPLGLGLVGYLLVLAMAHRACLTMLERSRSVVPKITIWAVVIAVLIAEGVAIARGNVVNVSVFVFAKPNLTGLIVLNAVAAVAANVVVFRAAPVLLGSRALQVIGARSLDIFLFHQFFLFPLSLIVRKALPGLSFAGLVAAGLAIALAALLLALGTSLLLDRASRIRRMIFPKDLAAFRRSWGFA